MKFATLSFGLALLWSATTEAYKLDFYPSPTPTGPNLPTASELAQLNSLASIDSGWVVEDFEDTVLMTNLSISLNGAPSSATVSTGSLIANEPGAAWNGPQVLSNNMSAGPIIFEFDAPAAKVGFGMSGFHLDGSDPSAGQDFISINGNLVTGTPLQGIPGFPAALGTNRRNSYLVITQEPGDAPISNVSFSTSGQPGDWVRIDHVAQQHPVGSLTVDKTIWLDSNGFDDVGNLSFDWVGAELHIDCAMPSGVLPKSFTVTLNEANHFQHTIPSIPIGSICHLSEIPPPTPSGFFPTSQWATYYLLGQDIEIQDGTQNAIVHNQQHFGDGIAASWLHVFKILRGVSWSDLGGTTFSLELDCTDFNGPINFSIDANAQHHFGGVEGFFNDLPGYEDHYPGAGDTCTLSEPNLPPVPTNLANDCQWGGTEFLSGSSIPGNPIANGVGTLVAGDSVTPTGPEIVNDTSYYLVALNTLDCAKGLSLRTGMTFGMKEHYPKGVLHQSAISTVGCKDASGTECNAYTGDTDCATQLPVLCFAPLPGQAEQNPPVHQFVPGRMKLTAPISGSSFATKNDADLACKELGNKRWRVAEFHEHPSGWNWSAFGSVSGSGRFWVNIKDRPANCWVQ